MTPEPSDPLLPAASPAFAEGITPSELRIPVIEEQLQVSKQTVETGRVRIIKTVRETEETVAIPLLREEVAVERIPFEQYVDEVPPTRQEGNTTIYPVVKEVLVVQKRLVLVEEIRVTRQQTQVQDTQTVRLRREEITVDRTPSDPERSV